VNTTLPHEEQRTLRVPDLADPTLYEAGDPLAVWKRLRDECPVYWNPPSEFSDRGFWALTRYADEVRVLRDTTSFTSEQGMLLGHLDEAARKASGRMLVVTDPPRHTKLRRIIHSGFTPRMVARLEENMRRMVDELLTRALELGTFDFVREVGVHLPASVICDMMGVPREDWERMISLTSAAFGWDVERGEPASAETRAVAHAEIFLYYSELVPLRRRNPGDDLVSALTQGEVDGERLSDEDVVLNCDGLVTAGNETTRHASAGGVLALVEHPEQWRRLREDAELVPAAVEEILRWTTPGLHVLRICTAAIELHGTEIQPDDAVTLWTPSANRDERVFSDPDVFDVARTPNKHLALGFGPHFCLGGPLARLELRVLFEGIRSRVSRMELAGDYTRLRDTFLWGFGQMPVTFA
jgi:cytochrome P450